MKRLLLATILILSALTMQAQPRCAVFQFQAGTGVNNEDIDGISYMFRAYFTPSDYKVIPHEMVVKKVTQLGYKQTGMNPQQLLNVGRKLDALVIVVGTVSKFMDEYSVTIDVNKVENNQHLASENATFARTEYRENMKTLVKKLTSKLEKTSSSNGGNSSDGFANTRKPSGNSQTRSGVEILYGYLKIFPNEIGTFQSEPTSVIAQINSQAQHGYNNWRIPTNEELSLLRANNYLGGGEYMTRESKRGIVLLVTDGEDYATVSKDYVDLGLASGTRWKKENEPGVFFTYDEAVSKFSGNLPSKEQFEELKSACRWTWNGSGYKVTGPNGNSIVLPAAGYRSCSGGVYSLTSDYWSSTPEDWNRAYHLGFAYNSVSVAINYRCFGNSVRLVQN